MGCLEMPAAPFDSTRRGRYDDPGGRLAKKGVPLFWKKIDGSPVVGCGMMF